MTAPLISAEQLNRSLHTDTPPEVADTRFSLADTEQGRREYLEAHIPTARYAHLDEDLSARAILAMEAAGLPGARRYPGSWSEWITLQ